MIMKKKITLLLIALVSMFSINSYSQCTTASSTYTDLNGAGGAPCTDMGVCTPTDPAWASIGVWSSEAYLLDNVQSGYDYTFDMCGGTGAGAWIPAITIVAPSGAIDAFDLGTTGTFNDNCALDWTATESGTYTIYIHETGQPCTGGAQTNNGVPTVLCGLNAAPCVPPVVCSAGVLNTTGFPMSICPVDSFNVATDGTEATNNDYAIYFSPQASGAGGLGGAYTLSGVTFPYKVNNDLFGVLSTNSYPVMTGEWAMYTIARNDTNGICDISVDSIIVDFLSAGDPGCAAPVVCSAGVLNTTGFPMSICPVDSFNVATDGTEATNNDYAIYFSPQASGAGGLGGAYTLSGVTFPYKVNNDLFGVLSTNSYPVMTGEWAMYTIARNDTNGICDISVDSIIVDFLDASNPLCIGVVQPSDCEDLIFSEIIEGSSNNKCIELYNPTDQPIDLSAGNYIINRYNNGSSTATVTPLTGIVPAESTFVICNSSAAANLQALADVVGGAMNAATFYNGDDVLELTKDNDAIILDVFGQIGFDPGSGWNDGTCATNNRTVVRNIDITVGDIVGTDTFYLTEWTCYPINDDTHLGWHLSDCVLTPCVAFNVSSMLAADTCGRSTGEIDLTVTGGIGSYTYSWSNMATTEDITGLDVGSFSVTITDENMCDTTISYTVTPVGVPVVLTTNTTDVTTCSSPNGTATVNVSSSNGPSYTYLWNDAAAQTTYTASALSAGAYEVTVTDGWGCSATANTAVANVSGFSLTVDSSTNVTCNGLTDGSIAVTTNSGIPTVNYAWTEGTTIVSLMEDLSGVGAGTYTLTATDAGGCSDMSAPITITEPDAIVVVLNSYEDVSCNGGTDGLINVTVSGGTGAYTNAWTEGTTIVSLMEDLSGVGVGTYTFAVTDANNCTPAILTQIIAEPTAISITVDSQEDPKCFNGTDGNIMVTVSGGSPTYMYSWSDGTAEVGTMANLSGVGAGTYILTVTDLESCTESTAAITLTEPSLLAVSTTATAETVTGSDGTATAVATGGTPNYSYMWTPSGQTTATATGLSPGTYSCVVTDANNCTASSQAVVVDQFVSINNIELSSFTIYPNPSNGTFTVQFETSEILDLDISLINTIGKKIFTNSFTKVNGKFSKQFAYELANGIYFLEINTKEGKSVSKLTINK